MEFSIQPLELFLKTSFQTAHSSGSTRKNALVQCKYKKFIGYGEAGLPPMKPDIYIADYALCVQALNYFLGNSQENLPTKSSTTSVNSPPILPMIKTPSLPSLKSMAPLPTVSKTSKIHLPLNLTKLLQKYCFYNDFIKTCCPPCAEFRACYGAIQASILHVLSQLEKSSIDSILSIPLPFSKTKCFVTVGITKDLESAVPIPNYPYIKFKVNQDLEYIQRVLQLVKQHSLTFCVDANASWSPEFTKRFCSLLQKEDLVKRCLMIEQPFPYSPSEDWKSVKLHAEKIGCLIYADESISTSNSLKPLFPYCHGSNIKLDKCGGIIQALELIKECQIHSHGIWFGCMVSTQISTSLCGLLSSFATFGMDCDGHLLISNTKPSVFGGIQFKNGQVDKFEPIIVQEDKQTNI